MRWPVTPRRLLRKLGVLAVTAVAGVSGASAADGRDERAAALEPLRLDYVLYAGGLRALEFATRLDLDADGYDLRFQARTAGWLETFLTFALESHARGERAGEKLSPGRFAAASRWNSGDLRWVRLVYDGEAPRTTVVPPPGKDDRTRVPESARRGTMDPLTAIYDLLLTSGPESRCEGEVRVFDGRRRFDITLAGGGESRLASDYSFYEGPSRVCVVQVNKVTGFWQDAERRERYPREIRVHLAPVVEGAPPLPVRMEADTGAFALRLHLKDVRTGTAAMLPDTGLPEVPREATERE